MTIRWTEAQNRFLIQLVKERTCLWLKTDPQHTSKKAREDSWTEIDQLLGTDGACRRFKSLRDDFTRWTKGKRKDYAYAQEMSYLRDQIGTRNRYSSATKHSLPLDTTIDLLDESDQSDGLYEEGDDRDEEEDGDEEGAAADEAKPQSFNHLQAFINHNSLLVQPEAAKRARLSANINSHLPPLTPANTTTSSTTITPLIVREEGATRDWQAPIDNSTITREDYQYCKTIISAMSSLPKARQRKLKSQIYNLITDAVNVYEEEQQQQQQPH